MRIITSILATGCLLVAATQAQDADKKQTAPEAPAHKTMLLNGCLVAGPDASTFKLTGATEIEPPDAKAKPVATSGKAGEYELRAEARLDTASVAPVDMKPFVGHQVEVSGQLSAGASANPAMKVASLVYISPTCPKTK